MPIIPGLVYERKVVEHDTYTNYSIHDLTSRRYEHWISRFPEDNKWWGSYSMKSYMPGDELWLNYYDNDPAAMSKLKRWDIVNNASAPKDVFVAALPKCTLSNHCYLSIRTPTSDGKIKYVCKELLTGHSVPCNIFDTISISCYWFRYSVSP